MFCEMYDEVDIIEATSNAMMAKLNYEFDMMLMEHRQNLADIELKAVLENCTDDDITKMYYTEAEEIQQKSKGIFRRIIDAIKSLFKKIKEFIFGSKDEPSDPNAKITLPEDPDALEKETRSVLSNIKEFLSGKKDTIKNSPVISGAVSGAATVVASKATAWLLNRASKLTDDVQNTISSAEKQMENTDMTPEQQNKGRGLLNHLQNCGARIMKCGKKIKGAGKTSGGKTDDGNGNDDTNASDSGNSLKSQIQTLENENSKIRKTMEDLESKMNGYDKVNSRSDKRRVETLKHLESIPERDRTPKEQAKYKKLLNERGILGKERTTYLNNLHNLQIRLNDNNKKIAAMKEAIRKNEKRNAKQMEKNIKKGNINTDDLLANANKLI